MIDSPLIVLLSIILGIIIGLIIYPFLKMIRRTKKLHGELDLFKKENQLEILLNIVPDYMYIKDVNSKYIITNKGNANVLKVKSVDMMTGKTDLDFFPKDLASKYYSDERRIIETGKPLIREIEKSINVLGESTYVSTSKYPLFNSKKEVIGIVGIGRDVAKIMEYEERIIKTNESLKAINKQLVENKEMYFEQAEELRLQTSELQTANEKLNELLITRDKFFSIIAHDLRNPVNLVKGFSELLHSKYNILSDEKRKKYIKTIFSSVNNLENLLQNLLYWARMQTDGIIFEPQKLNVLSVVQENLSSLSELFKKKNITAKSKSNSENLIVFSDKYMIDYILRNLLINAIKFSLRGGEIEVVFIEKIDYVEFCVSDNGIGMDDKTKNHLFEIDRDVSRQGTEGETGTGLGLVLCKEFVRKNNGELWCESEKDKGTKIHFSLPKDSCSLI